jgi:hypothetical protein
MYLVNISVLSNNKTQYAPFQPLLFMAGKTLHPKIRLIISLYLQVLTSLVALATPYQFRQSH